MPRDFTRKTGVRKVHPRILILCEDSTSSLTYLEEASQRYRSNAIVKISHPGKTHPIGIVDDAIKEKNNFDEIYCVLDRDEHDRWEESLQKAKDNNIEIIPSYPCYEYWLLLHFKYSRKSFNRQGNKSPGDALSADLKKIDFFKDYKKGSSKGLFFRLEEFLENAKSNAERCLKDVERDPVSVNPSTHIHKLIKKFIEVGA